jgi:hypothetical protein
LALNRALAAYADSVHWTRATPDDWITTAALSFAGAGIILHTGIGLRWPFTPKATHDPSAKPACLSLAPITQGKQRPDTKDRKS